MAAFSKIGMKIRALFFAPFDLIGVEQEVQRLCQKYGADPDTFKVELLSGPNKRDLVGPLLRKHNPRKIVFIGNTKPFMIEKEPALEDYGDLLRDASTFVLPSRGKFRNHDGQILSPFENRFEVAFSDKPVQEVSAEDFLTRYNQERQAKGLGHTGPGVGKIKRKPVNVANMLGAKRIPRAPPPKAQSPSKEEDKDPEPPLGPAVPLEGTATDFWGST